MVYFAREHTLLEMIAVRSFTMIWIEPLVKALPQGEDIAITLYLHIYVYMSIFNTTISGIPFNRTLLNLYLTIKGMPV